jgi:hypothetical protein
MRVANSKSDTRALREARLKNRGVKPIAVNSIPGQVEQKLERKAAVWRRRCEGATMTRLAGEFGMSIGAIYNYIEEVRKQLREATIDLAALEREQSLALIDTALEQVMPHIHSGDLIKIQEIRLNRKGPIVVEVAAWEAKMKGCEVMVKLLDRKAKLLGMDAPVKTEVPTFPPETEEQRARARAALRQWTKFACDPQDFISPDLANAQ